MYRVLPSNISWENQATWKLFRQVVKHLHEPLLNVPQLQAPQIHESLGFSLGLSSWGLKDFSILEGLLPGMVDRTLDSKSALGLQSQLCLLPDG